MNDFMNPDAVAAVDHALSTTRAVRLRLDLERPVDDQLLFLHLDHVGWNTRLQDGRWVPTFPNARYLYNKTEFEHWSNSDDPYQAPVMADSVNPIIEARLADLVADLDLSKQPIFILRSSPGGREYG